MTQTRIPIQHKRMRTLRSGSFIIRLRGLCSQNSYSSFLVCLRAKVSSRRFFSLFSTFSDLARQFVKMPTQRVGAFAKGEVHILFKDREAFERKKAQLIAGGIDQLQVIADFDRTLTSFYHPRKRSGENPACHAVCERFSKFPPEYGIENQKLFEYYFPLETSVELTHVEKYAICMEWWTKVNLLSYLLDPLVSSDSSLHADFSSPPPLLFLFLFFFRLSISI